MGSFSVLKKSIVVAICLSENACGVVEDMWWETEDTLFLFADVTLFQWQNAVSMMKEIFYHENLWSIGTGMFDCWELWTGRAQCKGQRRRAEVRRSTASSKSLEICLTKGWTALRKFARKDTQGLRCAAFAACNGAPDGTRTSTYITIYCVRHGAAIAVWVKA